MASSDIIVNEFSTNTSDDWVEIYNKSTTVSGLLNYRLRDSTSSNKKDLSGEVSPGEFFVVDFSNYLNKSGDVLKLIKIENESEILIEEISYGDKGGICTPTNEGSIGRVSENDNLFIRFENNTKGGSNKNGKEAPCLSPSEKPTIKPKSSNSGQESSKKNVKEKENNTVQMTSKPVSKISSSKKIIIPSLYEKEDIEASDSENILGDFTKLFSSDAGRIATSDEKAKKNFPFFALFFVFTSLSFLFASSYISYKKIKQRD